MKKRKISTDFGYCLLQLFEIKDSNAATRGSNPQECNFLSHFLFSVFSKIRILFFWGKRFFFAL